MHSPHGWPCVQGWRVAVPGDGRDQWQGLPAGRTRPSVHSGAACPPASRSPGRRVVAAQAAVPPWLAEEASTELGVRPIGAGKDCGWSAQCLVSTAGHAQRSPAAFKPPASQTRGFSCESSRGGRPPVGWGAHRRSVSWHPGNTGARRAGPWLSRTSRSFPSYHRCHLGAPGARARSRFTIKVIVSHIQRGSDVHCGRGQREASRDAAQGTQGLGGHRPVAEPHPVCDCIGPGSTTGNAATHKPRRLPLLSFTPF